MTWKNKKVLVTGADGFIASHLTEKLIDLKAKLVSLLEEHLQMELIKIHSKILKKNILKKSIK